MIIKTVSRHSFNKNATGKGAICMEPIKRVPLVHQVEERIKDLIKEEKLQPGTKLPTEKELCTNLNVSRGTVREAFRFLQAKGIVELKTGKGAFVAEKRQKNHLLPSTGL